MKNYKYWTDQYGHLYRWEPLPDGCLKSVCIASFQQYGSREESNKLIDVANQSIDLYEAFETLHKANVEYFKDFEHLHPSISGPMVKAVRALVKAAEKS